MSSPSYSDEENANSESKVNKNNEAMLETDLNSLQVKETLNEAQSSTKEEGNTVKKKSSTHNLSYEDSIRNKIPPVTLPLMPKWSRDGGFSTSDNGTSSAESSNWRSSLSHNPREKKECTPVSQPLSWRDPNYKYERCQQNNNFASSSRKWRNEDIRENRSQFLEHNSANLPTFAKNRDRSKMGHWSLSCAPDIVLYNGLTEVEHVRNCVNELHKQCGELFATRHPSEFKTPKGDVRISCFTSNYEDKVHVAKVADLLMEKIEHYPYCFVYFYHNKPLYMRTCEKELYESAENNWKVIDFDE